MMQRLAVPLLVIALLLGFGACNGGNDQTSGPSITVTDGLIEVQQDALASLTSYTFVSKLDVLSGGGDFAAVLDGAFQTPDRFQGTFQLSGALVESLEAFGEAVQIEVVVIGERVWLRQVGSAWQPGIPPGSDSNDPFFILSTYMSPRFYLEQLIFESLLIPVAGEVQSINGVRAFPVRLDKSAILELVPQGSGVRDVLGQSPDNVEDIDRAMPGNILIETWLAENGVYPVRIVVAYSVEEGEPCSFCFGFERPLTLRLQMDITNPNANIQIEPPIPIPTDVPTPTTPPGELTGAEQSRIMEIVSSDPRIREMRAGGMAATGFAGESWHTSSFEVLGGYAYVNFNEPRSYQGSLPSIVYDETETSSPPFAEVETEVRMDGIERLLVLVYLPEERVVQIEVVEAATPPPRR